MGRVTIRDIARETHTSVSTVSRVLNGSVHVASETKQIVEEAVKRLRYIPDSRAQSMRWQHTHFVGLMVPDITNRHFALLAQVIKGALLRSGYLALLGTTMEESAVQDLYATSMLSQHVDGAIVIPQGSQSPAMRRLFDSDIPIVLVDRPLDRKAAIPLVDSDPVPGMNGALKDFRKRGHTMIGYLAGPVRHAPALKLRRQAFERLAVPMFGEENVVVDTDSSDAASFHDMLGVVDSNGSLYPDEIVSNNRVTALLSHNVLLADSLTEKTRDSFDQYSKRIGVALQAMMDRGVTAVMFAYSTDTVVALSWINAQGIRLGKDLSLVSFDNLEMFDLISPRIAAIAQPDVQMGVQAAELMLERIDHIPVSSVRIPTRYIHRESVGTAPGV
ncbi:MAG: LacI family DNA-binding transcriptional regulator [Bifidobacteriaceae bacterium]|nr:LacI family DNA-binding transcriptional regulator [Bifidobacteriaceae bacterium]